MAVLTRAYRTDIDRMQRQNHTHCKLPWLISAPWIISPTFLAVELTRVCAYQPDSTVLRMLIASC